MPLASGPAGSVHLGAEVRLISSLSRAMHICSGHGGWVAPMEATLGKVGVVVEVLHSGNLRIQCGSLRPYIYPPAIIAEHLTAQTGPPLFALELHPHSLSRLQDAGQCSVCHGSISVSPEPSATGGGTLASGFGCVACAFSLCDSCSEPYQLPAPTIDDAINCRGRHGLLGHAASSGCTCDICGEAASGVVRACRPCNYAVCESCCNGKRVAEVGLRFGSQCKLEVGSRWVTAVVTDMLPDSKVRLHAPMQEVPDEVLEVTSSRLRPKRVEALDLLRHPCHPEALHGVCFPGGLRGTLFGGAPIRCASEACMPGGCRGASMSTGDDADSQRVLAYFCPRTAFLLCQRCAETPDLGEVSPAACRADLAALLLGPAARRGAAAERILGVCQRSQQARLLYLEAGICETLGSVVSDLPAEALDHGAGSGGAGAGAGCGSPSSCDGAVLALLTRLAEWLYLVGLPERAWQGRVLVEVPLTMGDVSDGEDSWQEAVVMGSNGAQLDVTLLREQTRLSLDADRVAALASAEPPPACVPLPKKANLPSPMALTQEWLMKHALPRNDLMLAKRVLMDRADLTVCDRSDNGVLAAAVEHQCSCEMVDLLLERDCPRSSKGSLGAPVAVAAKYGRLEVVKALLDAGCDATVLGTTSLPDVARRLLGYMVPGSEAVLHAGLPLRRLRSRLAELSLPSLARIALAAIHRRQACLDAGLAHVMALCAENCAPSALESPELLAGLVRVCRGLVTSFDSAMLEIGLRLASCLRSAGPAALTELERHGVLRMLRSLAAELSGHLPHQPPRPQHVLRAARDLIACVHESDSLPAAKALSLADTTELLKLTPRELVQLEVPQRLWREGVPCCTSVGAAALPPGLARLLVQAVEEEESFSVHVFRERQDVGLRVLTEPFWLLCSSAPAAAAGAAPRRPPEGAEEPPAAASSYIVQAEPLVTMEGLDKLLLLAGRFLSRPEYLRQCLRHVGLTLYQGEEEFVVKGVVMLPNVALPLHVLESSSQGVVQRVLALSEYHVGGRAAAPPSSRPAAATNDDPLAVCSEDLYREHLYPEILAGYGKGYSKADDAPQPAATSAMDDEDLCLELLLAEAVVPGLRDSLAELCGTGGCVPAVVVGEASEVTAAIAQSVDGVQVSEGAEPLLRRLGWREPSEGLCEEANCSVWDPPQIAPVLPDMFKLRIEAAAPDEFSADDPVWSVVISFDAEVPFELVWPVVEMDVKQALTSVSNKWTEMGWVGGEQEMLTSVRKSVSETGRGPIARALLKGAATRIAERLQSTVSCVVVPDPEMAMQAPSPGPRRKAELSDVVEVKSGGAWVPAVLVQESPSMCVTLGTGALVTGQHRVLPTLEGPRLYPVPLVKTRAQTRASFPSLERGAECSRVTRRFSADAAPEPPQTPRPVRGALLKQPYVAYSLAGGDACGRVSLLRGRDVQVDGLSWVSRAWTTVGLPELRSCGKVYYELHVTSHNTPQVGWASDKFRFFGDMWSYGAGDDAESWAVDGGRQKIWHGGEAGSYPSEWPTQVVIGCAADVAAGTLLFSTDGVWVSPPTFSGVRCACLYPAVSGEMEASFKIGADEWRFAPPDPSYTALSSAPRSPTPLLRPVRFPRDWLLSKSLQYLAELQQVDLLTTLHLTYDATLDEHTTADWDEPFAFVLDSEGQPLLSGGEAWAEQIFDALGLPASSPAGAALRVLRRGAAEADGPCEAAPQSPRLSAKLSDLVAHQVALVSGSIPAWALRLCVLAPWLFERSPREVLLRSSAFGLSFAVHDLQTREVERRYSEVVKAAEERVAQAKNLGDQHSLSHAYENLFELTKQISQDPEVWIGSMTSELAKVERDKVWEQAEVITRCCADSAGVIEVQFQNESGFGRGVTQGFFSEVAKDLQRRGANDDVPMWAECLEEGEFLCSRRGLLIQPLAADDRRLPRAAERFRSLGRLVALALRESFVVPLPISATVFRQIRGDAVASSHLPQKGDGLVGEFTGACQRFCADVRDLGSEMELRARAQDPSWAREYLGADVDGSFEDWSRGAEFVATGFGGAPLGPLGRQVSLDTLKEFVDAATSFWLDVGVREQVRAFRKGLHDILGARAGALWLFTPLELRELVCGEDSVAWTSKELHDCINCGGGFTEDDDVMVWLREELLEMSQALRSKFLDFATSCPRLPPGGLPSLKLTVSLGAGRYPRSRACANQLYLPRYQSRLELREMLTEALEASEGHHEAD